MAFSFKLITGLNRMFTEAESTVSRAQLQDDDGQSAKSSGTDPLEPLKSVAIEGVLVKSSTDIAEVVDLKRLYMILYMFPYETVPLGL